FRRFEPPPSPIELRRHVSSLLCVSLQQALLLSGQAFAAEFRLAVAPRFGVAGLALWPDHQTEPGPHSDHFAAGLQARPDPVAQQSTCKERCKTASRAIRNVSISS